MGGKGEEAQGRARESQGQKTCDGGMKEREASGREIPTGCRSSVRCYGYHGYQDAGLAPRGSCCWYTAEPHLQIFKSRFHGSHARPIYLKTSRRRVWHVSV